MIDVAIVGAGPAGSNCAYNLAQRGICATIFDHSHPREKPCGGMIGTADKEAFSILEEFPIEHSEIGLMRLISPSQKVWNIDMTKNKLLGFSRMRFDQYLLNKALSEGANLIEEKVIGLQKNSFGWRIITQDNSYDVRTLVGADGVSSVIRKCSVGALDKNNLGACFGYIFKGIVEKDVVLKFLSKTSGYIWVIPRGDNTCIGGGSTKISQLREIKKKVDLFIEACYPRLEKVSQWSALIPNVKNPQTLLSQVAGPNWALIGDAAGHVSPISGMGIVYALTDGELAAEAIAEGHVEQFNKTWVEFYGKKLVRETWLRSLIYQRPILEAYCMYIKLHSHIRF